MRNLGKKSAIGLAIDGGAPFDFKDSFTIDDGNGAATYYGEWINIWAYNELYADLKFSAAANRDDETIDVSIVRETSFGDEEEVVAFTQFAAQGAAHKEQKTAKELLGLRIRVKIVAAGTFAAGTTFTFAVGGIAKRV